ncbi:hypothetical protein [Acetobacter fallax]|uniref:Uncharacterized protein n=1 Tax=Acetobacter fallax TaxID=1737473 RepID=A0ABX0KBM1_9PROT|nr:hypothetical protein [Acetobacter fallax]NHO33814.1 hypothetical protein [Acetobacter fallax]NHO37375.1 hypothetical protein [Acetobacter fallax]
MRLQVFFPTALTLAAIPLLCASALATPPVSTTNLKPATIETPAGPVTQQLRDGTATFIQACRGWTKEVPLQTVPSSLRHHDPATTAQFNLCQMAMHPDQFHAAFRFYTMLGAWGILLSIAVAAYLFIRISVFAWRFLRQRRVAPPSVASRS